jgi:hypothetical protein
VLKVIFNFNQEKKEMNEQVNNSVKEVFECVMLSDLPVMTKFKITEVLTLCEQKNNVEKTDDTTSDDTTSDDTTPDDTTPKVTIAKKPNRKNAKYVNKRWEESERESLFRKVKSRFGGADTWAGRVTPPAGNYFQEVMVDLAKEFGRTPGSIKAQIHDVVSNTYTDKNEPSIRKAKKVALDIGLITKAMYNN